MQDFLHPPYSILLKGNYSFRCFWVQGSCDEVRLKKVCEDDMGRSVMMMMVMMMKMMMMMMLMMLTMMMTMTTTTRMMMMMMMMMMTRG